MIRNHRQIYLSLLLVVSIFIGCASQKSTLRTDIVEKLKTEKAGKFDTGKMWTFDFPPYDYFKQTYGFNPTKEWFEKARLAALRLPGCSASFVSEDGLVMTNHHCARGAIDKVNKEGENLPDEGFYAPTLADERKIPGYYVEQLIDIIDVTDEVKAAFEMGKTDEEKINLRSAKIREIEKKKKDETGLECSVVTFFNGGKYSLYCYKRYNDVRLVFAPETQMGFYGGDYDNFTYPRYDLDCTFYRVYDDEGKPLNTKNFFKFNKEGAKENDFVMVLGNPGRTSRLLTFEQLEYNRDYQYPTTLKMLDGLVELYTNYINKYPEKRLEYQSRLFGIANSQKAYRGMLGGLQDPTIMARKYDFQNNFKNEVMKNPELAKKYGNVWEDIEELQNMKAKYFNENVGLNIRGRSQYFSIAYDIVDYAKQMLLPEAERDRKYKNIVPDSFVVKFYPSNLDNELEKELFKFQLNWSADILKDKNEAFNKLLKGMSPQVAADVLLQNSVVTDKEKTIELLKLSPDKILQSQDPLVQFCAAIYDRLAQMRKQNMEINQKEQAKVQLLGNALFDIYGTSIPPDATFTLRMADGIVKGYEYNGTIAPPITTFYGLYDRYYSFKGVKEFDLPAKWVNPPASFDKSTPFNFVSTSDIIGGNSGSPIVNKDLEVVGLVFDGNIESLPSDIIYLDKNFRAVGVQSVGMLEAIKDIYNAENLFEELVNAKLPRK